MSRRSLVLCSALLLTTLAFGIDMSKTRASEAGLKGPVKQCIDQTTYPAQGDIPERTFTVTSSYSAGGQLLERRSKAPSAPDAVATTYTYGASGHLLKTVFGAAASDAQPFVSNFTYDAQGRLTTISLKGSTPTTRIEYGEHGRTREVRQLSSHPDRPNTAIGAIHWEDGDIQFPPPSGGTLTTFYDDKDRPIRAEIADADGRITMRIARQYDEQGHIASDQLTSDPSTFSSGSNLPDELTSQLNEAQKKGLNLFIAQSFGNETAVYRYDSEGRLLRSRSQASTVIREPHIRTTIMAISQRWTLPTHPRLLAALSTTWTIPAI